MVYGIWKDGSMSCLMTHGNNYKWVRRFKDHNGHWVVSFCSSGIAAKKRRSVYLPGDKYSDTRKRAIESYEYAECVTTFDTNEINRIVSTHPEIRSNYRIPRVVYPKGVKAPTC